MILEEKLKNRTEEKPFKILGIEHIGIAVDNLDVISNIFGDLLGLNFYAREKVKDQHVITYIYKLGNSKLEFLEAINDISPIYKFIDKKGKGIHHIALKVDDLKAAIEYLNKKEIKLIDKSPKIGAEGLSIAFIHPKSTENVLIELCQSN